MHGEGNYQVRIMQGTSCLLTGIHSYSVPVETNSVVTTICEGEVYPFGDLMISSSGHYIDTFKSIHNCDSIVDLDLQVLGIEADSVSAKIFEGETYTIGSDRLTKEGNYLVYLVSSKGCDSLVYVQLSYYHVFIPNIFSPNGDGVNDVFSIMNADDVQQTQLTIIDRWGNQIFSGSEWDGRSKDAEVNPGVYTYIAAVRMSDGEERRFSGSVTVIR
jgi:gliding motility-associated-like protein